MSNENDLTIVARVKRAMPRNPDVMYVCAIAERLLTTTLGKEPFDRTAYQREYMRKWRAKKKSERQ